MTDIDFSLEEADAEFMRLIDDMNAAAECSADAENEAHAALYAYGAWLEEINGTQYFRHPSRKAAQS